MSRTSLAGKQPVSPPRGRRQGQSPLYSVSGSGFPASPARGAGTSSQGCMAECEQQRCRGQQQAQSCLPAPTCRRPRLPVPANVPSPTQQSSMTSWSQSLLQRFLEQKFAATPTPLGPLTPLENSPLAKLPATVPPSRPSTALLATRRLRRLAPDSQGRKAAPEQAGLRHSGKQSRGMSRTLDTLMPFF